MYDEFDFFETDYQDDFDEPVKVAQKRVRKGAQASRAKKKKESQKVTMLSLSVVLMGIVLIISLLFQFSMNSRYQELSNAMERAGDMTDEDGTSLVSRVSELETSITAINTRVDQLAGSLSSGVPDEVSAETGDDIDQETQDRTTEQIRQSGSTGQASSGSQASSGTREYTVQAGDSPWAIANSLYGDPSKMQEILELNGLTEETASSLKVGQVIKVPAN